MKYIVYMYKYIHIHINIIYICTYIYVYSNILEQLRTIIIKDLLFGDVFSDENLISNSIIFYYEKI